MYMYQYVGCVCVCVSTLSRVPEELTVAHVVKKFPTFIIGFTRARHWSLS